MSNVDALLSRLEQVRQTGAGRWISRCPAHGDKGPSLSIRELDDGRVLLHCFAGCEVEAVLDAVGLTFDALFPEQRPESHHCRPERRPWPASDVLRCLAFEALIVANASRTLLNGQTLTEVDHERLITAAARIGAALDAAGCHHG
jgi:hypothetical protein